MTLVESQKTDFAFVWHEISLSPMMMMLLVPRTICAFWGLCSFISISLTIPIVYQHRKPFDSPKNVNRTENERNFSIESVVHKQSSEESSEKWKSTTHNQHKKSREQQRLTVFFRLFLQEPNVEQPKKTNHQSVSRIK
jgi:hypothetical protein